jgi:hypothetical protein
LLSLQVSTAEAVDAARELALKEGLLVSNCTVIWIDFEFFFVLGILVAVASTYFSIMRSLIHLLSLVCRLVFLQALQ